MNTRIFILCFSSFLVIHSIHNESALDNDSSSDFSDDIGEDEVDEDINSEDIEEREGRQFFRPLRFRRPFLSPTAASLFATIPTLFGENISSLSASRAEFKITIFWRTPR